MNQQNMIGVTPYPDTACQCEVYQTCKICTPPPPPIPATRLSIEAEANGWTVLVNESPCSGVKPLTYVYTDLPTLAAAVRGLLRNGKPEDIAGPALDAIAQAEKTGRNCGFSDGYLAGRAEAKYSLDSRMAEIASLRKRNDFLLGDVRRLEAERTEYRIAACKYCPGEPEQGFVVGDVWVSASGTRRTISRVADTVIHYFLGGHELSINRPTPNALWSARVGPGAKLIRK